MPSTCSGRLGILFALALLVAPSFSYSDTKIPIKRQVLGLAIGMEEDAFLRKHAAELIDEDAAAGQRSWRLSEVPDDDLRRVTVVAFDGKIYKIDLEFSDKFIRSTGWFDLVRRYNQRYGASRISQIEGLARVTDLVEWEDGQTRLVLRHVWNGKNGKMESDYFATYMDDDYYAESLRSKRPLAQKDNAVE